MLQAIRGVGDIFSRPDFQAGPLFGAECFDDFPGRTKHERTGRDFHALRHQRVRTDEALLADFRAVQNDRAHADEAFVADGAGVNNGGVADGDKSSEDARKIIRQMHDGIVLNVAARADDDAIDVAAQNGVVPNADLVAQSDVAEDHRAFCDVNVFAERRFFAEIRFELLDQIGHGLVLMEVRFGSNAKRCEPRGRDHVGRSGSRPSNEIFQESEV